MHVLPVELTNALLFRTLSPTRTAHPGGDAGNIDVSCTLSAPADDVQSRSLTGSLRQAWMANRACCTVWVRRISGACLTALLLLACMPVSGQKFLQLEKSGTLKTVRFYAGDALTFRIRNDETGWHTRYIQDFDLVQDKIIFPNLDLPVDSISMIRLPRTRAMHIIGRALQAGGINTILFSATYSAFDNREIDWTAMTTGAANIAVGTLFTSQFRTKRFKVGKRKRLRLLDISFPEPVYSN